MPRKSRPREEKVAKGTLRADRDYKAVPARVDGEPQRPKHLTGYALEFWEEYSVLLRARGQFSKESRAAFHALCACYGDWRELREDLETNGRYYTVRNPRGDEVQRVRPALVAFNAADHRLRSWLSEFGLTDVSRNNVDMTRFDALEDGRLRPVPRKGSAASRAAKEPSAAEGADAALEEQLTGDDGSGDASNSSGNPLARFGLH